MDVKVNYQFYHERIKYTDINIYIIRQEHLQSKRKKMDVKAWLTLAKKFSINKSYEILHPFKDRTLLVST